MLSKSKGWAIVEIVLIVVLCAYLFLSATVSPITALILFLIGISRSGYRYYKIKRRGDRITELGYSIDPNVTFKELKNELASGTHGNISALGIGTLEDLEQDSDWQTAVSEYRELKPAESSSGGINTGNLIANIVISEAVDQAGKKYPDTKAQVMMVRYADGKNRYVTLEKEGGYTTKIKTFVDTLIENGAVAHEYLEPRSFFARYGAIIILVAVMLILGFGITAFVLL